MTEASSEGGGSTPPLTEALSRELQIVNRKGLHARATAKFVQCVDRFDADVKVTRCGETVGGDSIMGSLTLGAGPGSTITVTASGAEAREGLEALAALVSGRIGKTSEACARFRRFASGPTSESPRPSKSVARPGAQ